MWMTGLLFNTIAGVYTLFQLRQRSQSVDKKEGEGAVESKKIHTYVLHQSFLHSCAIRVAFDTNTTLPLARFYSMILATSTSSRWDL
jgi:hypothetical protein